MHQRTQWVGSEAHCGSARIPLLGPGAGHLNQTEEVREAAKSRSLKPAHLQAGSGSQMAGGLRVGNGDRDGANPHPSSGQSLVRVKSTRNSGRLHNHQSKPLTLCMPMAGSVPS